MEFQAPDMDIWALLPGTLVAITALVVLLDGVFRPEPTTARTVWLSSIGLAAAAVATVLATIAGPSISFAGMLLADRVAAVLNLVFLAATVVGILLAADHL
ncbi:MAG: hypothetical protein HUU35_08275, partial [Armatimonadetes bacterium]|nr:hypothetical protein [Armatimonadota bacterium]